MISPLPAPNQRVSISLTGCVPQESRKAKAKARSKALTLLLWDVPAITLPATD